MCRSRQIADYGVYVCVRIHVQDMNAMRDHTKEHPSCKPTQNDQQLIQPCQQQTLSEIRTQRRKSHSYEFLCQACQGQTEENAHNHRSLRLNCCVLAQLTFLTIGGRRQKR